MALLEQTGAYVTTALLNVQRGITFPTPPANFYLALYTTMPTKSDGTGAVEVSGGSYARQAIASATGSWSAPVLQADNVTELISTLATITFPTATSNWGTIAGVALYDASTGGNLWRYGQLSTAYIITSGATASFSAGALSSINS